MIERIVKLEAEVKRLGELLSALSELYHADRRKKGRAA